MPTYEYKCEVCSIQFELKLTFDGEWETSCPRCRGKMRRVFSAVPVIFKSPGFYVTDSRQKEPGSDEPKAVAA